MKQPTIIDLFTNSTSKKCSSSSDLQDNDVRVELDKSDEVLIREVADKLQHLYASLRYPRENVWNRVMPPDGSSTRRAVLLRMKSYKENLVDKFRRLALSSKGIYFLGCPEKESHGSDSTEGEQPTSSLFLDYKEVSDKLHDELKLLEQKQNPNLRGKLEARFSLPNEILEKDMSVEEVYTLLQSNKIYNAISPSIDDFRVKKISQELADQCPQKHVVQTFNFSITVPLPSGNGCRVCKNVRAKVFEEDDHDTLKIIRVKKNEARLVAIDVLCPNREHDFRLDLECFEFLQQSDPEYNCAEKLIKSLSSAQGHLTFQPYTDKWMVELLRHKKQTTYVLEDTFLITISDVKECKVEWGKHRRDEEFTVDLEHFENSHWELELNNILWECAFARDVGHTPEEALSSYMEHPSIEHDVMAKVPHPWDPESLLSEQDLQSVFTKIDWINEQLS